MAVTENVATVSMVEAMIPSRLMRVSALISTTMSSGIHPPKKYAMQTQETAAIPMMAGLIHRAERSSRAMYLIFVTPGVERSIRGEASGREEGLGAGAAGC